MDVDEVNSEVLGPADEQPPIKTSTKPRASRRQGRRTVSPLSPDLSQLTLNLLSSESVVMSPAPKLRLGPSKAQQTPQSKAPEPPTTTVPPPPSGVCRTHLLRLQRVDKKTYHPPAEVLAYRYSPSFPDTAGFTVYIDSYRSVDIGRVRATSLGRQLYQDGFRPEVVIPRGARRVTTTFATAQEANALLDSQFLAAHQYRAYVPSSITTRQGVV